MFESCVIFFLSTILLSVVFLSLYYNIEILGRYVYFPITQYLKVRAFTYIEKKVSQETLEQFNQAWLLSKEMENQWRGVC